MPPIVLKMLGLYAGNTGGGRFKGRDPVDTWAEFGDYKGGEWLLEGGAELNHISKV